MENDWKLIKEKKEEMLNKNIIFFSEFLNKIRSNKISLNSIKSINLEGDNIQKLAILKISPKHEIIIKPFNSNLKLCQIIAKKVLDEQLGYKVESIKKDEIIFSLSLMTKEIRNKLVKDIEKITISEEAKIRVVRNELRNYLKKNTKKFSQNEKNKKEKEIEEMIKKYQEIISNLKKQKILELTF